MAGRGGRRAGAGRKHGSRNKRTTKAEAYALGVIEDAEVQAMLLAQARAGQLAAPIFQTLMYYAWGKPMERLEHATDPDKPLVIRLRRAHGD